MRCSIASIKIKLDKMYYGRFANQEIGNISGKANGKKIFPVCFSSFDFVFKKLYVDMDILHYLFQDLLKFFHNDIYFFFCILFTKRKPDSDEIRIMCNRPDNMATIF